MPIKCTCAHCGDAVFRTPAQIARVARIFCSRACTSLARRTRVERSCERCGQVALRYPADAGGHERAFCSQACAFGSRRDSGEATFLERLWSRIDKHGPVPQHRPDLGPCWLWNGACNDRYGKLVLSRKSYPAHRVTWETRYGPIPLGMFLDHLCRVKSCVNPSHLEAVTPRENVLRGLASAIYRTGACRRGHVLTPETTIIACKVCHEEARRRRQQRAP